MALYYAAFLKPILLFDNPSIELGDVSPIKILRENTDVFNSINELNPEKITARMQSYNVDRLKELADSIFGYPGQSVARQVEEIYKTLSI